MAEIGLGLAALGRPGYINVGHGEQIGADHSVEALERRTHEVLDAAFEGGVRYFDAARSYGRAEEFLSSWLRSRGVRPGEVTVASKWGYRYTGGWRVDADTHEVKDLSLDHFRSQLAETLELLGEHLSLYQIHSATVDSGVFDDDALLAELAQLRATGVHVGVTATGVGQPATIARALDLGAFDAVQATWNLLEPSAGPALAQAHEGGMRVIVKEALANGRLGAHDAVALAAALEQPWADVVLSGAATVEQLRSNLAARDLAEAPEEYWRRRSELPWT
jgi:aryl-alcohol dehydrogenase-like predicted oxidoreductase